MGLFDKINSALNTVSKATSTVNRGMSEAQNAKRTAQSVGSAVGKLVEKKCKSCSMPLKSGLEKQKGICADCALKKM